MRKENKVIGLFMLIISLSVHLVFAVKSGQNAIISAYYNVVSFGAKADGLAKDTYFVQNAIDTWLFKKCDSICGEWNDMKIFFNLNEYYVMSYLI